MSESIPSTSDDNFVPEKFIPFEEDLNIFKRIWINYKAGILAVLGVGLFLLFWQFSQTKLLIIEPYFIPPFFDILEALWENLINLEIPERLAWSLRNYVIGYLIGMSLAIPFGLAMGSIPLVNRILSPYLWLGFVIPRIAFLPIVIIALGFGPEAKILFISISCFFPIIINTIAGVQTVSPSLVKVGRMFGGTRLQVYRKVVFPYAINFILTGMRIAARTGLVVMYATEIFGSENGLGYYVVMQSDLFHMEAAFAGLLVLVVVSMTVLTVFDFVDGLLRPWKSEVAF